MNAARLTFAAVVALVAAAVLGVCWKIPAWKAELLDSQDEVVAELIEQMRDAEARGGGPGPSETQRRAEPSAAGDLADGDLPVAGFVDDDLEAARAGRRVLYQYTDASGQVRFVPSLREVPPELRERAGRLEMRGDGEPAPSLRHLAPRAEPVPAARARDGIE